MYIEAVPNRNSPPAVLLRESYREAGKVKKRTLANLSKWPPALVDGLKTLLKGATAVAHLAQTFDIVRSLPHGHVAAVLALMRSVRFERLLDPTPSPERDRALALIAARLLDPASKLATARGLDPETARDSLAESLALGELDENALYGAMDWLLERQDRIERRLAKRHLEHGALGLYDLTSVWYEGQHCPLAKRGHSREGKRGKAHIEFGLLCSREGCPVAVEVFEGHTADPATVGGQIDTLRRRFGLHRVVRVGDRGRLTEARIREQLQPAGLNWVSALRSDAIRKRVEAGAVQMSVFDERDRVEGRPDAYPGERLMGCRTPLLAAERAAKRETLLQATEALLDPIVAATARETRPLKGQDRIGVRVGKVIGQYKMAKHFTLDITEQAFHDRRNTESIAREAALDALYVVRTSVVASELDAHETVRAYKRLSTVERAFRCLKTVDLKGRPIYHRAAHRVRAHVWLCLLAYSVEWHLRDRLKALLFDDEVPGGAPRPSVVAPAHVSDSAKEKAHSKRTAAGWPVHSLRTLLDDLATLVKSQVVPRLPNAEPFELLTRPTALQREVFQLLGVRLEGTQ